MNDSTEGLANIAYFVLIAFFIISTTILPVLIYIILTQSTKEMGSFKIFLCSEIFWSYIFGLYVSLIHPEMYFPHIMGRITGPINILCSQSGCNIVIELLFFVGAGYAQSMFCIILFRLWWLSPMSITFIFNNQLRILTLLFAFLSPTTVFVAPVVLARVNIDKGLNYIINDYPELKSLIPYKSQLVIYDNPENNDFWVKYIVFLLTSAMFLIIVGSTLLLSLATYLTYKNKGNMSPPRYKMSLMLLKTTILQVLLAVGLLVFPLCIAVGTVMCKLKYANSIVFIMFSLTSSHSLVEFICILFMVKQYRNYVIKKFYIVKAKIFGGQEGYRNRVSSVSELLTPKSRTSVRTSSLSSQHGLIFD